MPKRDNVIQFPGPKKPRPKPRPTLFVVPKKKWLHNPAFLCGLVLCVLAVSVLVNVNTTQPLPKQARLEGRAHQGSQIKARLLKAQKPRLPPRALASLSSTAENRTKIVRRQLAAKSETVLGRRPSSIDSLQFGFLAGHYSLKYMGSHSNFIKSLKFVKKQGVFPVLVSDRAKFLNTYASLWPVQFDKVLATKRQLTGETLYESYRLQFKGQPVATVKFELDRLEHLLRLHIELNE